MSLLRVTRAASLGDVIEDWVSTATDRLLLSTPLALLCLASTNSSLFIHFTGRKVTREQDRIYWAMALELTTIMVGAWRLL